MLIAVTGKIATGKSTLCKNSKYTNLDFDAIAYPYRNTIEVLQFFSKHNIVTNDFIWTKVLTNPEVYKEYCAIYEYFFIEEIEKIQQQYKNDICIIEASALYAYPRLWNYFDEIVEVWVDKNTRIERYKQRQRTEDLSRLTISDNCYKPIPGAHHLGLSSTINFEEENPLDDFIDILLLDHKANQIESVGWFCGSFDPFTIGHQNILEKAQKIFDKVFIVKAQNPDKAIDRYEIPDQYKDITLTTNYIPDLIRNSPYIPTLIRGIRDHHDAKDAIIWKENIETCLGKDIDLVTIVCDKRYQNISSSLVRAIEKLNNEDYRRFII